MTTIAAGGFVNRLAPTEILAAELLVRPLMAGSLQAIHVPSSSEEAAHDLARGREGLREDLMRSRHRVAKLVLRHCRVDPAG